MSCNSNLCIFVYGWWDTWAYDHIVIFISATFWDLLMHTLHQMALDVLIHFAIFILNVTLTIVLLNYLLLFLIHLKLELLTQFPASNGEQKIIFFEK